MEVHLESNDDDIKSMCMYCVFAQKCLEVLCLYES